jgi:ABC-2 type transport system permease protein
MLALLKFEWHYHTRGILSYVVFVVFFALGFLLSSVGGYSFPGMHRNSPYMIADVAALLSLTLIFSAALLVARSFLRERDHNMEELVYTTPVPKVYYLGAGFLSVFFIGALSCLMMCCGMAAGHCMPWLLPEELGAFELAPYLWAYVVVALPNVFFCTALFAAVALFVRNRLAIYISALLVYILYMTGSALSNSPLLAGSSPASAETMSLAAKLDPFGLAAFFEQTRYWTALQRNTNLLALEGNFLFNRVLWTGFSILLLVTAFYVFRFRKMGRKKVKSERRARTVTAVINLYSSVVPETGSSRHSLLALRSFVRIDVSSVVKNIFFPVILITLCVLLPVEFASAIDGGTRMPESLATTGLMINVLTEILPVFTIFVLLFYGSEIVFRSAAAKFAMIEDATPYSKYSSLFAKLAALSVIVAMLITVGILLGILFQLAKANAPIDLLLYLKMYYFIGFPMFVVSAIVLAIQVLIKNRFAALAAAAVITMLFCTGLGRTIGITHPLLRIADVIQVPYYEMNGYGGYASAFHIRMLYGLGFAAVAITISVITRLHRIRRLFDVSRSQKRALIAFMFLTAVTGTFIYYRSEVMDGRESDQGKLEWKLAYEQQFRKYQAMPLPTVTDIKTKIDLFPSEQRYEVHGSYRLVNNAGKAIHSISVYFDRESKPGRIVIPGAKLIQSFPGFGHYWFRLDSPLQAGDTLSMTFAFRSGWDALNGHTPFNSIIANGTFIRISNYFPRFGYQPSNETGNELERAKRKMRSATPIKKLEDKTPFSYDFINLDAVVSTSGGQTVIGSGRLQRKWNTDGRAFFHYKTDRPVPFRFAFSSAHYNVKRSIYKGLPIEIYYDDRHGRNVNALIEATKQTLDYCKTNFGGYPFDAVRYAEISSFAEGFAATAYPGVIYMKENGGFPGDYSRGNKEDVANQLAGHELSHQWWGQQLSPDEKEGGWLLTETLAQYTELMLYERAHGREKALETIRIHLDQYLANRPYSEERPLYKTHYDTPHLPYNKGMVIMHQLRFLIGEKQVNLALRSLIKEHAFPNRPPDSRGLANVILKFAPAQSHAEINRMFKEIVTCSSKLEAVSAKMVPGHRYKVSFTAVSETFAEDGKGGKTKIAGQEQLEIGFVFSDGSMDIRSFPIRSGVVSGNLILSRQPVKAILDPNYKTIDTFPADNEKPVSM